MPTITFLGEKNLASYTVLLRRVRQTIAQGKERAADAVERERVKTAWETGKLIHEHILLNRKRANYGEQVLKRLARDLEISRTELGYMVQFAKTEPIYRTFGKLGWSHIQSLLAINEDEPRKTLIDRASKNKWSVHETRREVKRLKATKQITLTKITETGTLETKKGIPYTYQIVSSNRIPGTGGKESEFRGPLLVDLGFSSYFELTGANGKRFKEGDFVRFEAGRLLRVKDLPLFAYHAQVLQVTDADTFWVLVHLGFGFTTKQHLRLRGLDAAEIATRDGQEAKRFVEKQFKASSSIMITTSKSDKYDRYLADVWIGDKYLNQQLIDKGLAVRVSQ